MTRLLDEAMAVMGELPEDLQDTAARQLIRYVEEMSTLDRWKHNAALADHRACKPE
jgi:hypothetical protein